jgi:hypothetical protein
MAKPKIPITKLHDEITEWKSSIGLVRDEISAFQKELREIVNKNNNKEALKGVEHFQNQFIRQLEISDDLMHDLHIADHKLAEKAQLSADSDLTLKEDDVQLRDKVETYDKLFRELENDYHLFLEKWM